MANTPTWALVSTSIIENLLVGFIATFCFIEIKARPSEATATTSTVPGAVSLGNMVSGRPNACKISGSYSPVCAFTRPVDVALVYSRAFTPQSFHKELSLADLLAEAHMSKSYFLRLFRRYMGTTPYNYLVNFRITQAKELLVLTDHSVGEIAQEVGFGDASNFSTRFAKATGQSPLQYRKSALKPLEGTR